jgi:hypothetical protein
MIHFAISRFNIHLQKLHDYNNVGGNKVKKTFRLIVEARAMALKLVMTIRGTIVELVKHNSLLQLKLVMTIRGTIVELVEHNSLLQL